MVQTNIGIEFEFAQRIKPKKKNVFSFDSNFILLPELVLLNVGGGEKKKLNKNE